MWTSRHQIRIAGKAIDYEATTGTLLMKNDKDEPYNDYARRELGVATDQKYELSAQLWKDWDFGHVQPDSNGMKIPYANLLPDLSYAMTMNPKMKVLVQQGYYDLACPYGTVLHAIDHLNITPELRRNVEIVYYEAGHMMYVHPDSMRKFAETSAAFIDGNAR